ncbi:uncharacterized protein LOC125028204 [Penaeus chinensis]|uniref:uncharacterized protein LOC125028204 n=1 Tax=Penaeus chinensis TaxID=139456 RepID=UPI001FB7BFF8|nr:uncharacterized protein LOC125028204 [Penaeus chinensis]
MSATEEAVGDKPQVTEASETMKGARKKILTEKGHEYQITQHTKRLSSARLAWRKILSEILSSLDSVVSLDQLNVCKKAEELQFKEVINAFNLLMEVDPSSQDELLQELKIETEEHNNCMHTIESKIHELKQETNSVNSQNSRSSKHSHSTKRSMHNVTQNERLQAELAKLQIELKHYERETEFQMILRKYKRILKEKEYEYKRFLAMRNRLAYQEEIKQASLEDIQLELSKSKDLDDSKELHLHKYFESIDNFTEIEKVNPNLPKQEMAAKDVSGMGELEIEVSKLENTFLKASPELKPQAKSFEPKREFKDLNASFGQDRSSQVIDINVFKDVVNILSSKSKSELPKPEPEIFSGDLLEFPTWLQTFEIIIESRVTEPAEKLFYLGHYTSGEAKDAIRGLLRVPKEEAYLEAKSILMDRLGNKFIVANAFRRKLSEWPKISNKDGHALHKLSDFLKNCLTVMKTTDYLNILNDPQENSKMLQKLSPALIERWNSIVYRWFASDTGYPPFSVFCEFIEVEAKKACHPISSYSAVMAMNQSHNINVSISSKKGKPEINKFGTNRFVTNSTGVKETEVHRDDKGQSPEKPYCNFCKADHDLDKCKGFNGLDNKAKFEYVQKSFLCRGCLKHGHIIKNCKRKNMCTVCKRRHPTSLHEAILERIKEREALLKMYKEQEAGKTVTLSNETHIIEDNVNSSKVDEELKDSAVSNRIKILRKSEDMMHSMIVPVWIHHESNISKKVLVYALLDEQSDACFIKESTMNRLNILGTKVHLKLTTVTGEETIESTKTKGLIVCGKNERIEVALPVTYSRKNIPARHDQIPRPESVEGWPHLQRIANELMPYDRSVEVGLLIGLNCIRAIKPRELIPGKDDEPYARRTLLGWSIIGRVNGDCQDASDSDSVLTSKVIVNKVIINGDTKCSFLYSPTKVKEIIDFAQLKKLFELDFSERETGNVPFSYQDKIFLRKMKDGIHQLKDGHYELPLPLIDDKVKLPNSKEIALCRLRSLKRKLKQNNDFLQDYVAFMKDLIKKGYAEEAPCQGLNFNDGRVWYIPHHGVYHPKKPDKIRVVFDCSAMYKSESLNKNLLQGPDLTNNLIGVLCRFRKEHVAIACDIEAMFHQVKVKPDHRDLLRFLWWENGDPDSTIKEYRMTVHLFGATSSPSVASFALKAAADDYAGQCGTEAASFVKNEFYVDDGLTSLPTTVEAISLIRNSKALCSKGGFKLHKFLSNKKEVLEAISLEEKAISLKNLDLSSEALPIERTLGVEWCIESDTFQFRISINDKPITRRGILSTVSSVFDPMGMVSPFILIGKRILQTLCQDGVDWDDDISDDLKQQWRRWRDDLIQLKELKIPRCYKPDEFRKVKSIELHHFSDASQNGYGQCSYLRQVSEQGQVHCALVMSKSRVTPLKPITVPRLELTAAVVAVRMSSMLKRELGYQELKEFFWTDSKVVLGYISNEAKRFHVFVANRVQHIKEHSSVEQWKFIESAQNPADAASRGLYVKQLIEHSLWWNGPNFLWEPDYNANPSFVNVNVQENDPEVKNISSYKTQTKESTSILPRLEYFSDWHRAKKAVALCLRLQCKFKNPGRATVNKELTENKESKYTSPSVTELVEAENEIIRLVQNEAFQKVKQDLQCGNNDNEDASKRSKTLKKASYIYSLDPFRDKNNILRVGGRMRHAEFAAINKHPVILPKDSHITEMIVCHYHRKVHHQGRGITLNELRASGYWIIGGSSVVGRHISRCVTCKRLRGTFQEQKMSDLPPERLEPAPPFTYCGVDYFGPFFVKEGRKEVKRYGVLFTCMASRAIHLETANTLETDSFLNAYRRFIGRRGPVRQLRSDQGTNFVGAKNELQQCLQEMDQEKLKGELLKENCDWITFEMNIPHASHMGGVWERQIRTVRNILTALLYHHGRQLDDESLRTFMVEAETIVNSRPLTVDNISSPYSLEPLTPNHLLTMKTKVVLPPPGTFQSSDQYSRKRWRRVQYLANEFWNRWRKEYAQSLQCRNKWPSVMKNVKVNDIVIVKEQNLPRNSWKLGCVSDVMPSKDGLVRKARITMADSSLDAFGRRTKAVFNLERPIHKLILLVES